MKNLLRKAGFFWSMPKKRKALFLQVVGLSLYRGLLILRGSPGAFSEKIIESGKSQIVPTNNQLAEAVDIAFSIQLGAKYIPWLNVCRHQSWQAIYLLKKREIPFSYQVGIKKSNRSEGHSWVMVGDKFISGECDLNEYHLINFSKLK